MRLKVDRESKYLKTFEKRNRLALKWGQQFFDWPDDASLLGGGIKIVWKDSERNW